MQFCKQGACDVSQLFGFTCVRKHDGMAFSTNPMSSVLLLIFSISAALSALTEMIETYRAHRKQMQ